MRITTERLALEPISLDYLESTYVYASDRKSTRYMCYYPHDLMEETSVFIMHAMEEWGKERPGCYEFVVLKGGRHVGGITLDVLEDGSVDLAWILDRRFWGRGLRYGGCAGRDGLGQGQRGHAPLRGHV